MSWAARSARKPALGRFGIFAGDLLLAGLELVDASLELLDSLPHGCEIARHRLEQLHRFGRQGGGGRHDALRCDLSQRLLVVEVLPTPRCAGSPGLSSVSDKVGMRIFFVPNTRGARSRKAPVPVLVWHGRGRRDWALLVAHTVGTVLNDGDPRVLTKT
jgi:hypothetical protein